MQFDQHLGVLQLRNDAVLQDGAFAAFDVHQDEYLADFIQVMREHRRSAFAAKRDAIGYAVQRPVFPDQVEPGDIAFVGDDARVGQPMRKSSSGVDALAAGTVFLPEPHRGNCRVAVDLAQKEWADFVHRRIKEDVAVSRQLMQCHSLADMHQIYSQYFAKAFEQYHQQSTKVVQRGQSMAEHLAEAAENEKGAAQARH